MKCCALPVNGGCFKCPMNCYGCRPCVHVNTSEEMRVYWDRVDNEWRSKLPWIPDRYEAPLYMLDHPFAWFIFALLMLGCFFKMTGIKNVWMEFVATMIASIISMEFVYIYDKFLLHFMKQNGLILFTIPWDSMYPASTLLWVSWMMPAAMYATLISLKVYYYMVTGIWIRRPKDMHMINRRCLTSPMKS